MDHLGNENGCDLACYTLGRITGTIDSFCYSPRAIEGETVAMTRRGFNACRNAGFLELTLCQIPSYLCSLGQHSLSYLCFNGMTAVCAAPGMIAGILYAPISLVAALNGICLFSYECCCPSFYDNAYVRGVSRGRLWLHNDCLNDRCLNKVMDRLDDALYCSCCARPNHQRPRSQSCIREWCQITINVNDFFSCHCDRLR